MKGKYIVFEGINGSGKDVQMEELKTRMTTEGYSVYTTRNPSKEYPVGNLLRNEYLTGNRLHDNEMIAMMLATDRYEQTFMKGGLIDKLNSGINVIGSRYYMSSLAYQGYSSDGEMDIIHIMNLNEKVMNALVPDITIYLDLDPGLVPSRVSAANEGQDIYETIEMARIHHKGYANAIILRADHPLENIKIIPADQSIADIHKIVWEMVKPILDN